jgi:hypothetical protein
MDIRERILRKIGSWPITHWVLRKFCMVMGRRLHKAPEVQERLKALSATEPQTQEQYNAFFEYTMALQKEVEKSRFSAWPPGSAQIEPLLQKIETGSAIANEVEEFRRLAAEVLRHPRCGPGFKKRIESALALVESA